VYTTFSWLGRLVFPTEFDRAFLEQLELSSAEENAKGIMKKGEVLKKLSTSHHFAHSGATGAKIRTRWCKR